MSLEVDITLKGPSIPFKSRTQTTAFKVNTWWPTPIEGLTPSHNKSTIGGYVNSPSLGPIPSQYSLHLDFENVGRAFGSFPPTQGEGVHSL